MTKFSIIQRCTVLDNASVTNAVTSAPTHFVPQFLPISVTALLLSISAYASAAQDQTLPVQSVDSISELIDVLEIEQSKTIKPLDEVQSDTATKPTGRNSAATGNDSATTTENSNKILINRDNSNTGSTLLDYDLPQTTPNGSSAGVTVPELTPNATSDSVDKKVEAEIDDQSHSDAETGQAVASSSVVDEDSIKSIENKNGKLYTTTNLSHYANQVNSATWSKNMRKNTAMTVKLQALLDWNHASPGPIDGGWGMNSKKALANFQTMHGLPRTGRMTEATWNALIKNVNPNIPVLVEYKITKDDVNTNFTSIPSGSEAKSKLKGLYYKNIKEMLAERFHMDVRYLERLNKGKRFVAGDTITVVNVGEPLKDKITRVVAKKGDKILYAYDGDRLVATYPTTVGSSSTPSPSGTYKIVNKVKMPWYKATVGEDKDKDKKIFMLPPGPNNPVGVVWMGLSKPSYGIHGSPIPEGISRQASHGCIRLTNWDVLEVYSSIQNGAKVELK